MPASMSMQHPKRFENQTTNYPWKWVNSNNWWSWYCRAAKPGARMEAITSRALLLAGVGRAVKSGGQTTLYLTPMHAAKNKLMMLIANVHEALAHVKAIAEQLAKADRWKTFVDFVVSKITRPLPPWAVQNQLGAPG